MASVRPTGFYNYVSRMGGMAQRFITAEASNTNKVVALSFKPLVPLIIAGSALIYNQGHESTKPGGGESNAWLRILTESGLAYLVLENTAGLYPLFGIGLAAYRAGKQSNALDQAKAVVNTAVTLFMGSVGVTFFKGMSKMAEQMDDQAIFRALHDQNHLGEPRQVKHIETWLRHLDNEAANHLGWNQESREAFGTLHDSLQSLKRNLGRMYPDWLPNRRPAALHPDSDEFRILTDEIMKAKSIAADHFSVLGNDAFEGLSRPAQTAAKRLMATVDHSQGTWTRMVRGMNPVFGYIIMGLMVGAPLAKWINSWIGRRHPELRNKQFHQFQFPEDNRVLPPSGHGGHGGRAAGHGSGYGQPYMVWDGMNNDQPTYSGDMTATLTPFHTAQAAQGRAMAHQQQGQQSHH